MVTKVVPVRNVSVRELAPILRQMIDSAGSGNVVNYDPSNVIMLTGRASVVERLTEVIQRVDHAGNRTEEVIPLDNASASEIARVLESLTKNSGENQPATLKSQIVADERTNSVIVSGDPATRDKMRRLIRRLDSEMERSGNSQVFYLKYSKAEDLVDVLKQVSGTLTAAKEEAEGTVGSGREIVSIAASKHSNALIVTAPQDIMQSLQSVIEQLDIRRAQVHVEALIVEVAEGSNINFGVQWASKDAGLMQFANGTQIPIGTLGAAISQAKPQKGSTVISENGATTINPDTNGDLSTLAQLLSGFSGTAVGVVKGDWMALVQAVKNDSSSNVLSTPSITTLDNQEAFFMVGQDVPVLTGSTVGSNNSNPFNTVERKKVGIMLKVTPQINEGNAVQMVIEQEVSKVEGQTSLDVVFGERKLKTTVLANDGELIVLGGLMDDQAGESVAKVPLLGDIPLIGNLFKSTADKKEKRNLMVFIRPTILRDGMAADGVSQRKYRKQWARWRVMILPILLILVALAVERGVTLWSVSEQVAQSRTQAEKQFLTLFPEQKRIVNLRSQVTMALKKYRPQADDTRLLAELSAIASTLKSASLSDIEMRGFTFDQKRQTLHLQLRAANFASFDKLRSALATDYVVQQDALQKEGDAVSGGVTLRRK